MPPANRNDIEIAVTVYIDGLGAVVVLLAGIEHAFRPANPTPIEVLENYQASTVRSDEIVLTHHDVGIAVIEGAVTRRATGRSVVVLFARERQ